MLKDRMTVNYVVYVLYHLNNCKRATSNELATLLADTRYSSISYLRKVLSKMSNAGLIAPNGADGFTLIKPYYAYTLYDILTATSQEPLHISPVNKAEDALKESAKNILVQDLL